MSRLGFSKLLVFDGDLRLGEVEAVSINDQNLVFPNNEIRINRTSESSERCHPLSVLQTISSSVVCKLEPPNSSPGSIDQSQLINLHASCFYELKTAVVVRGNEEVHLVAMPSKQMKFPCFWCYSVPSGLYEACLGMLNMRCLAIVFDLDETLIVANTMKSFEDRIEALRGWIQRETDPIRITGMSAEMKRYMDDRALLKQYTESDCVLDGGKVYKVQEEEVTPTSDGCERVIRPVIRFPEKNVVLTRINPEIRDTSVLVRLRPAWEDLRSYLIAKGRRRFEVYVCTMAERDYALEIWRLLDPGANLISLKQLPERVVCVKSGDRKSLCTVFQGGNCHPKMAMVIDDRLKVWDDKDQPCVHVVPPFTPYYAPQAETASVVPVLCVARNVACNVRGGFFREFDENLLRRIGEVFYEDDVAKLPSPPDVCNYLMTEDTLSAQNGNSHPLIAEGMTGPEVAQRLNQVDEKNALSSKSHLTNSGIEQKVGNAQLPVASFPNVLGAVPFRTVPPSEKPSLLGSPFGRDGTSEAEVDMQRKYPIVNRGQDVKYRGVVEPPILSKVPGQLSVPPPISRGGWVDEEMSDNDHSPAVVNESNVSRFDKQQIRQNSMNRNSFLSGGVRPQNLKVKDDEANKGNEWRKANIPRVNQLAESGSPSEGGKLLSSLSVSVLQEIGKRCGTKVEFRPIVGTGADLQFSVEVLFGGDKIGVGTGKMRKDAQHQAADNALRSLADKYVSSVKHRASAADGDAAKNSLQNENGFLFEVPDSVSNEGPGRDGLPSGQGFEMGVDSQTH
ncbi:protein phosphatase [Lithospermum erythrorhizon]|uniref:protein-serine/threonine phosphatase n=1 Tax=Lithospermum erythrorhizon TaxID=34254 RepID=A0AAV3PIA8_LITER